VPDWRRRSVQKAEQRLASAGINPCGNSS